MLQESRVMSEAVDRAAFAAGRLALDSGAVSDFDLRPDPRRDRQLVTASVKSGGLFYDVSVTLDGNGDLVRYDCDCPAFYSRGGACAHVVAVLLTYIRRYGEPPSEEADEPPLETDLYAGAMLQRYGESEAEEHAAPNVPLRLEPTLILPDPAETPHGYSGALPQPRLELRFGGERMVELRDIVKFCADLTNRSAASIGGLSPVTLTPDAFEPRSRELALLVAAKQAERAAMAVYPLYERDRRSLRLTPNAVDRLLALYERQPGAHPEQQGLLIAANGRTVRAAVEDGDPAISLNATRDAARAGFRFESDPPLRCLCGERRLYVLTGGRLCRCSEELSERLRVFLTALDGAGNRLTVSARDLPSFCSVVLPRLHGAVGLRGDLTDLAAYRPEPFTVELYLDLPAADTVSVEPMCVYGAVKINPLSTAEPDTEGPRRDLVRETQVLHRLQRWFTRRPSDPQRLYARGDDAVYALLTDGVQVLMREASLFVTTRLRELRVLPPPKVTTHVRFTGSVLELSCSAEGFTSAELADALAAYRLGRGYYRLRNGQFLSLKGEMLQELTELADGLGVDDLALAAPFTVPQYRALFLEGQMQHDSTLRFERDAYFTRLVEQIGDPDAHALPLPATLRGQLRGYQETGMRWLSVMEKYGFGGILADDMGLGKTIQMIALFLAYAERVPDAARAPSLVVCPTSIVLGWAAELARFAPGLRVLTVIGTAPERNALIGGIRDYDVAVTSYDLLRRDVEAYMGVDFHYLVLDEAQYIKNSATRNAQAVKALHGTRRFALTGTPIENRLSELWSIFDFLMPGYLYEYPRFRNLYELPAMRDGDREAMERLHRMVAPFILRRLKRDVLTELPPKVESVLTVRLTGEQRKLYVATALAGRDELIGGGNAMQILALLMRLRQICCDPALCCEGYTGESAKLDCCMELLREATGSGHKALLFSQFTSMLTRIEQRLNEEGITSFLLRGSTPKEKRAQMVESFNCDDTSVFLCSLKAGGTGLNLTGADVVIHYDPWWNIAAQNQATDRAHRIGQRSRVQVYKLIAEDSIEERILDLQARKQSLADAIVQDGDAALLSLTKEELLQLVIGA